MAQINRSKGTPARYTKEELYNLLPSIYRQRDAELCNPLLALIGVIAEQVGVLECDIQKLYDNWFIETCDPWVVPYIGDLVGATFLHPGVVGTINRRSFVANTISYRRRKGTLVVIEHLAKDITGWGAKAVEFFDLLSTTQHLNHLRASNLRTPDLRKTWNLELLNTPFDTIAHTAEVRNIRHGNGCYNIPNIGIFLWRLKAYPVIDAPAYKVSDCNFTFSSLGLDTQLFNHPMAISGIPGSVKQTNLPTPISRLTLYHHLNDYYANEGEDKSIKIITDGSTRPVKDIIVCDLTNWEHRPPTGSVAVDPVLGRIAFSSEENPQDVHVSYYYGFSSEVGGGFYERPRSGVASPKVYKIAKVGGDFSTISYAADQWAKDRYPNAVFEIMDNEVYTDAVDLTLPQGTNLEIRSDQETRPIIRNADVKITGEAPSPNFTRANLVVDGLLFDRAELSIQQGDLGSLTLRHCTLVPSQITSLGVDRGNDNLVVTLDHTIAGRLDSSQCEAVLQVSDCIIDGKSGVAMNCHEARVLNSTVFGEVDVVLIDLISNSIFTDKIIARRRQTGCVRFSCIPFGSRVPRRYHCQPDYPVDTPEAKSTSKRNVRPRFTSKNYSDPGYAQLHKNTQSEIYEGADNGNEMGVFNQLQQAVRLANLKSSLYEYTRFGLETGVFEVN